MEALLEDAAAGDGQHHSREARRLSADEDGDEGLELVESDAVADDPRRQE
jgi:hypothetical protein